MISIEKLCGLRHGIFHANCPDGIASALILKDALPALRVSFVHYGTEEHKNFLAEPGQVWCDFSPPKEHSAEFAAVEAIVLDHHSRDVVEPYGELGVFGENAKLESGAMLAFKHVWFPLYLEKRELGSTLADKVGEFAHLAAVRDTWAKADPDWQLALEQAEELRFWGFDGCTLANGVLWPRHELGKQALLNKLDAARHSIDEAHCFTSARGTRVLMFQGVSTTSDAAEILDAPHYFPDPPNEEGKTNCHWCGALNTRDSEVAMACRAPQLVVGFHYRVSGGELQLQFSTRSHTGFDCQALARAHGGNGHKAAAGFTVQAGKDVVLGNPFQTFQVLLETWEAGR